MLHVAAPGGVFLLNSPHGKDATWDALPLSVQRQIIGKRLRLFVIDASKVARDVGLGVRTNTVLQTCFFATSRRAAAGGCGSATSRRRSARPTPARARYLALLAIAYGNVYVAQVAMGANAQQTLDAFREAEAYDGPSPIIAYSQCIAHDIDMRFGMKQQDLAVACGYWR